MMRRGIASLLLASCALAGCGGEGGSTGTAATPPTPPPVATPTPMPPTPPPAPAPPPPAGPTYATFDQLTGDQSYAGNCAGYLAPSSGIPRSPSVSGFARSGPIVYTAATQTYTVSVYDGRRTYAPGDRVAGTPTGTIAFSKGSGQNAERFEITQPVAGGVPLVYARQGYSLVTSPSFFAGQQDRRIGYCLLGNPTLTTDIPTASTVTFPRLTVRGDAYDRSTGSVVAYTLGKSTATMTVDLTTGRLQTIVHLIGTNAAGGDIDLGTYDAAASLDDSTAGFIGGLSPPMPGVPSFTISGGFYGPQGKEFGYAFSRIVGEPNIDRNTDVTIAGVVFGAR